MSRVEGRTDVRYARRRDAGGGCEVRPAAGGFGRSAVGARGRCSALREVAGRARPLTLARDRCLPVLPALAALLPEAGLRRGSTVAVTGLGHARPGPAGRALGRGVVGRGRWACPSLGLEAAAELGVALERLALVPAPGDRAWPRWWPPCSTPSTSCSPRRRPGARRARPPPHRPGPRARGVLVVLGSRGLGAEPVDLQLTVTGGRWEGLGRGHGQLRARQVEVVARGRRAAARERRARLWLPGPGGERRARRRRRRRSSPVVDARGVIGRAHAGGVVPRLAGHRRGLPCVDAGGRGVRQPGGGLLRRGARRRGRRGLRRREAQSRCPGLVVVEHDPARDARAFEPVVAAVEAFCPGVEVVRPGVCAFATRGPSRYFGGDDALADAGGRCGRSARSCRVGVADGPLRGRAGGAARDTIVPPGGERRLPRAAAGAACSSGPTSPTCCAASACAPWATWPRCPPPRSWAASGPTACAPTAWPRGSTSGRWPRAVPPPDLEVSTELDPPAERVDVAAFAAKALADELHARPGRRAAWPAPACASRPRPSTASTWPGCGATTARSPRPARRAGALAARRLARPTPGAGHRRHHAPAPGARRGPCRRRPPARLLGRRPRRDRAGRPRPGPGAGDARPRGGA